MINNIIALYKATKPKQITKLLATTILDMTKT